MGNRNLDDLEQWEYIQEWKKRKNAKKQHWMMVKNHLKEAFRHLVIIFKGGEVK